MEKHFGPLKDYIDFEDEDNQYLETLLIKTEYNEQNIYIMELNHELVRLIENHFDFDASVDLASQILQSMT